MNYILKYFIKNNSLKISLLQCIWVGGRGIIVISENEEGNM